MINKLQICVRVQTFNLAFSVGFFTHIYIVPIEHDIIIFYEYNLFMSYRTFI